MQDFLFHRECYNLFLLKVFHIVSISSGLFYSLCFRHGFLCWRFWDFCSQWSKRHPKADGKLLCMYRASLNGEGVSSSQHLEFLSLGLFSFSKNTRLLHAYQPSGSKADKDSLGEEKAWIPDVQCIEFSLLLLFLASHLKLIAGCPGTVERLFHLSRENSLSVLFASTLAPPPPPHRICFNLELEWSC